MFDYDYDFLFARLNYMPNREAIPCGFQIQLRSTIYTSKSTGKKLKYYFPYIHYTNPFPAGVDSRPVGGGPNTRPGVRPGTGTGTGISPGFGGSGNVGTGVGTATGTGAGAGAGTGTGTGTGASSGSWPGAGPLPGSVPGGSAGTGLGAGTGAGVGTGIRPAITFGPRPGVPTIVPPLWTTPSPTQLTGAGGTTPEREYLYIAFYYIYTNKPM